MRFRFIEDRRVVGWAMQDQMGAELPLTALSMRHRCIWFVVVGKYARIAR
jgi:hypothetical protein